MGRGIYWRVVRVVLFTYYDTSQAGGSRDPSRTPAKGFTTPCVRQPLSTVCRPDGGARGAHPMTVTAVGADSGAGDATDHDGLMDETPSAPPARPSRSIPAHPGGRRTGSTAVGPPRASQPAPPADSAHLNVDPGALALASLAAAAAFLVTSRPWDLLSSGVGITLLVISLANHRAWTGVMTVRGLLQRLTFTGTAALALCIAIAWPVRLQMGDTSVWILMSRLGIEYFDWVVPDDEWTAVTTEFLAFLWIALTVVLFVLEPRLSWLLELRVPSRRQIGRRLRRGLWP